MGRIRSSIAAGLLAGASCLFLSCGKSGDKASCGSLCEKLLSCDAEMEKPDCLARCEQLQTVLQGDAFDEAASCVEEASCDLLEGNEEVCVELAAKDAPADALDGLISALCTKINTCMPDFTVASCAAIFENPLVVQEIGFMKVVRESIVDCVAECFSDLDCGLLVSGPSAYQAQFQQCARGCGIPL